MKRAHLLPAAAALGAHALLLFGFTSAGREPAPPPDDPTLPPEDWALVIAAPDPAPSDLGDAGAADAPPKPRPPVPFANEVLNPPSDLSDFVIMPRPAPLTGTVVTVDRLPIDWSIGTAPGDGAGPEDLSRVLGLEALDNVPSAIVQVSPQYPYDLRRAGIGGAVTVAFLVDVEGRVRNPYVVEADHPELEGPALSAVSRWRFEPGKKQGRAVPFRMSLPFVFSVHDRP